MQQKSDDVVGIEFQRHPDSLDKLLDFEHHKMLNENFKGHENPGKRTTGDMRGPLLTTL